MTDSIRHLEPLGATEFAAALNGDNPTAILRVLTRFAKQVRQERHIALSLIEDVLDEGDAYSSSEELEDETDGNAELNPPPTKKLKKTETWKEDTNSYHVPFVGTAVTKGDISKVVKGVWPTGLLKAYLSKSPLAVELTGDDWIPTSSSTVHKSLLRRKQTKLSRAIYKAYLKALTELVTASIALPRLRNDLTARDAVDDEWMMEEDFDGGCQRNPFLTALLKQRLVGMFHLLVEETDKGNGKPGIYGGCGKLVPVALRFLNHVARTSIGNARLICRFLDEELQDGVLKALLRPPSPPRRTETSVDAGTERKRTPLTKPARAEAIRLASTLLQTGDSAVAAYICTAGSRERKIKSGIVYWAFREGLARHSQAHGLMELEDPDDYFDSVSGFLETARKMIQDDKIQRALSSKLWQDLFARGPLSHLCDFSVHAPSVNTVDFLRDVITGDDIYMDLDESNRLLQTAIEARRLLYLLLADNDRSPLLRRLTSQGHVSAISGVMLRLLQVNGGGMQARKFLLQCVQKSPLLLPEFFRGIVIPDPGKHFAFISTLRFLATLMQEGPSPRDCFLKDIDIMAIEATPATDLLNAIWPLKLKRQVIVRAMQSGNQLVVLECVKFLVCAITRFVALESFLADVILSAAVQTSMRSEYVSLLPDLQVILAVRSKQDLSSGSKGDTLTAFALHLLLDKYTVIFPEQVRESSFDWMKLLPKSDDLLNAPIFFQRKVMQCLGRIVRTSTSYANTHVNSIQCVLDIMLRTNDSVVHDACFDIARIILLPVFEGRTTGPESIEYVRVELNWWLDALTMATLSNFCELLSACTCRSLDILGEISDALTNDVSIQNLNCSVLMMAALAETQRENSFTVMLVAVATKLLLFHRDPVPFAKLILSVEILTGDRGVLSTEHGSFLVIYARSLVEFRSGAEVMLVCLKELLSAALGPRHTFLKFLTKVADERKSNPKSFPTVSCDVLATARFYIHLRIVTANAFEGGLGEWFLRRLSPALVSSRESDIKLLTSMTVEDLQEVQGGDGISEFDIMLLSYPQMENREVIPLSQGKTNDIKNQKFRKMILTLPLLCSAARYGAILKGQLGLLQEDSNDKRIAAKIALALDYCVEDSASACPLHYDFEIVRNLFQTWWSFSHEDTTYFELSHRLEAYFSGVLADLLIKGVMESTYLLSLFTDKTIDTVIRRCLGRDRLSHDSEVLNGRARVLESLLKIDPLRFAPCFLDRFSDQTFLKSPIWSEGKLDAGILMLVDHLVSQKLDNTTAPIIDACVSRVMFALSFHGQVEMKEHLERRDFGALALVNNFMEHKLECTFAVELAEAVWKALSSLAELRLLHNKHVSSVCRLGVSILASGDRNIRFPIELDARLRNILFLVLSERLLVSLKKTHKHEDCTEQIKTLDSLIYVMKSARQPDSGVFTGRLISTHSLAQKLCRSGLKHGIHDDLGEDRIELGGRLLKFVRLLLIHMARDATSRAVSEDSVKASDVISMATSHSKFGAMISRKRNGDKKEGDRLALVLLMQTCIELSPSIVSVGPHVWKLLWSATFGGLDKLDTAIGRFGDLCSTRVEDSVAWPFLDEARVLGGEHAFPREGRRWDWLLDGLDPNRIQETISCFPIGDIIDMWTESHTLDQGTSAVVSDSDDEHHVTSYRVSTESNIWSKQSDHLVTTVADSSRDKRYHRRYNPAYILPLLLGALHSCTTDEGVQEPHSEELPTGSYGIKSSTHSFSPLASMVRRMCDKGVPGLCLASLASRCEKIRAFSVSILGLLLKGCNTEEARAMASWRDRPQLVMLLSSVRRAFVLERAKLSGTGTDIPILPTLVATFLARSSQSISKPDDPMYAPLNRYFLKSEAQHGAFQDMSRLPGFIALYCSSGDDPIQSRKERIWALNHIRDGFLDPSSYRLVASCHAPELLLTSLENIRLSSFSDEMKTTEYSLLFDAIITFLVSGGLRAASHLVDKIGLLSWLCSLCTSRPVSETFPIDTARVKILDLIEAAMNAVCGNTILQRPTVIDECCKLLLPVIQLSYVSSLDKQRITIACKAALRALASISKVVQLVSSAADSQMHFQHVAGLDLRYAMTFLQTIPADLLRDGIFILCQLPCNVDARESCIDSAGDFCSFVLEWQVSEYEQKRQPLGRILQRIVHVVSRFGGDLGEKRNLSMVRTLLSSRSLYQATDEDSCLWIQCLKLLSVHLADGTYESELTAAVLKPAC